MIYTIKNLNDGLNIMDDPSSERMGEGETVDCLGFDLTVEGRLQTSRGNDAHGLGTKIPDTTINWLEIVYLNNNQYVLCATPSGLYANGTLINSGPTERFKALVYGSNIYITSTTTSLRFDGTTCYRWGILHPRAMPTITISDNIIKQIDTFAVKTGYIANAHDCTVGDGIGTVELLTNGTFTGSGASWTIPGAWSYNADAMDKDADGVVPLEPNPAIVIMAGKSYYISYVISNWTVGTVTPSIGGTDGTTVGANGTYTETIQATDTSNLKFTPTNTARFTIDTISMVEAVVHGDSNPIKFTVAADTRGYSYQDTAVNCAVLDDASVSPDADLLQAWIYVDNLENLSELRFIFDVNDKTFTNDMFMYSLPFSGADSLKFVPGLGAMTELPQAEAVAQPIPTYTDPQSGTQTTIERSTTDEIDPTALGYRKLISDESPSGREGTTDAVDLTEQMQLFWRKSNASEFKSGTWSKLSVPKSYCTRFGSTADKGWATLAAVKIEVASVNGAVNVYIADLRIAGGGKLHGDYWFAYGWARGGTRPVHYSAPAKNTSGEMIISGPHKIERQPVTFGTRTASTDPQVDACVFYVLGGGLPEWWVYGIVGDNLTTGGSLTRGEDDLTQQMVCLRNDPAPKGKDLVYYLDRIWIINDTTLMCSEIGADGTVMMEGWPVRNGYIFSEKGNTLKSLRVLNNQMILRSSDGEWRISISDPTDYTSVSGIKLSNKGIIGEDSILEMEDAHIFPSPGALVMSNGTTTKDILPKVSGLMTWGNMGYARAVRQGTYGFFSFALGTVKVDFYRGTPRLSYHNDIHYAGLEKDEMTNKVYGLHNGAVYLFDSGYTIDGTNPLNLLVTTRAIAPLKRVAWKRVSFYHNTGGNTWFVSGLIDGKEYGSKWFKSTERSECRFDFIPTPGETFQLRIIGDYASLGEIYYPIRVYADGA